VDPLERLSETASQLSEQRQKILLDLASALSRPIDARVLATSDIASEPFVEGFSGRLLAHHALHEQKLTKKAFEYAFVSASNAANRTAEIVANATNPGADVLVDGVPFSLKTEGAKSMSRISITISKLMEARWIRECASPEDYCREVTARVPAHLNQYSRVLILRAFELPQYFEYDLIEIPLSILHRTADLSPSDFTARTINGGSSARVSHGGNVAFTLRIDGSVEKITVSGLKVALCISHATWRVGHQGAR
jgi:Type II site-specific deoxyribonuclease